MTKTVRVLTHVAFEDLGSFEQVLCQRGFRIDTLQLDVDALTEEAVLGADLVVVLGGPISVNDTKHFPFLVDERALIARRLSVDAPTLGICLGAQLMSVALGGAVSPMGHKEIGFAPISVHSHVALDHPLRKLGELPVVHWHGEQFTVPEGAVALASTAPCANQAFSWKQHGLALQFHPEVTPRGLNRWLIGHVGELEATGIDISALRAAAATYGEGLAVRGQAFFDAWLIRCGL
jgi:GMP synthase (glutamine-hydrolysing)